MKNKMKIDNLENKKVMDEMSVMDEMLDFTNSNILEIGCGNAKRAQEIALSRNISSFKAVEVDLSAHKINLSKNINKLNFDSYPCEDIQEQDRSFDIVMMLKSFHHVSPNKMFVGLKEINRVLKSSGLVYISEPIFDGNYNNVIRIFHNEQEVRALAFEAIKLSIEEKLFELVSQFFYSSVIALNSFEEFENNVIKSTHTTHDLSCDQYIKVKDKFESYKDLSRSPNYFFEVPMRVDLLRKIS